MRKFGVPFITVLLLSAVPAIAVADIPHLLNIQGYLTDQDGPVSGEFEAVFRIYDAPAGGNILWQETNSVTVEMGLYSTDLGQSNPININFEDQIWIGVQFSGHPEMTPRYRQTSVPFTYVAEYSDSSATVSNNAITSAKILDGTIQESDLSYQPIHRPLSPGVSTNEIANDAINSSKIQNGSISFGDVGQNGASNGQIMKWNGSAWVAANDESGSGGDSDWVINGNNMYSGVSGYVGIGTSTPEDRLDVVGHFRVSGSATIGSDNLNPSRWAFVTGSQNAANGQLCTITGGSSNNATGAYSVIGGGVFNRTPGLSSAVSGGDSSWARAVYSAVGGGLSNTAGDAGGDTAAFVGGGAGNEAINKFSTVAGGRSNIASGQLSSISGGANNTTAGLVSTCGGGGSNSAAEQYSVIGGGFANNAAGAYSTIGGGRQNSNGGSYGTIGGGYNNTAQLNGSAIAGGFYNSATDYFTSVGGGNNNTASVNGSSVGGGLDNLAADTAAAVGGGRYNFARGKYSVVAGGGGGAAPDSNSASGDYSAIGGGQSNAASGQASTIGGGEGNTVDNSYSTVAGGLDNAVHGGWSAIGGGRGNVVNGGGYSYIGGGSYNVATNSYATVPGGRSNYAVAPFSFAAGNSAKANHSGSMVFAANSNNAENDSIRTSGDEQMILRADGGIYITNIGGLAPYSPFNIISTRGGAYLSGNGTNWTNASDRNLKENFQDVDSYEILEQISSLPIKKWNYISESDQTRHIGPVAQDFYEIFGLGGDDKTISTIDPSGVALAGMQELIQELKELKIRNEELEKRIADLESRQ